MGSVIWGAAALVAQVLILNRYFFPSRFAIDEAGITAWHPLRRQRLEWSCLRRFVRDDRGGFLSSRPRSSRWDGLGSRSMHILFGSERERIVSEIRRRLAPAEQGGLACAL